MALELLGLLLDAFGDLLNPSLVGSLLRIGCALLLQWWAVLDCCWWEHRKTAQLMHGEPLLQACPCLVHAR